MTSTSQLVEAITDAGFDAELLSDKQIPASLAAAASAARNAGVYMQNQVRLAMQGPEPATLGHPHVAPWLSPAAQCKPRSTCKPRDAAVHRMRVCVDGPKPSYMCRRASA